MVNAGDRPRHQALKLARGPLREGAEENATGPDRAQAVQDGAVHLAGGRRPQRAEETAIDLEGAE